MKRIRSLGQVCLFLIDGERCELVFNNTVRGSHFQFNELGVGGGWWGRPHIKAHNFNHLPTDDKEFVTNGSIYKRLT